MNNVRCKDPRNYALTAGKEYESIKFEEGYVFINNDNNKLVRYSMKMFEEIIPEPERTEKDVIASVSYDDGDISFVELNKVKVIIDMTPLLEENPLAMSCGIVENEGINNFLTEIHDSVETDEDDRLPLKKEIFKKGILGWARDFKHERGLVLFSTTTDADNDLLPVMDEIAHITTETFNNPQTNHSIKMWGFYTHKL